MHTNRAGLEHLWLPYTQMQTAIAPLEVDVARGSRLFLKEGQVLIDGVSSWWTQAHGYNHPYIREAIEKQLIKLPHIMLGGLVHEQALKLAKRLAQITPGMLRHTFFSESGSVSVEIAMKMAVQYWLNQGIKGKSRFLSFRGGYHGDTFSAMSVCDPEEGMHTLFSDMLQKQIITDLPMEKSQKKHFLDLLFKNRERIAAVILEPLVQGAGGMRFHSSETLSFIAESCQKQGILLILDEIMTGFGRTGTLFACEQAGVCPDIMTLSKALTGGFLPFAATLATGQIYQAFLGESSKAFMHGPTYTGHALGCAAANASLDLFEQEDRLGQVRIIEEQLHKELAPAKKLENVKEVRVKGAIGVVECHKLENLEEIRALFIKKGVWVRPLGNVIYLMPAFTIRSEDLSVLTRTVLEVLKIL